MLQDSDFAADTAALKLENCLVTFFDPHAGQSGRGTAALRTSFSNPLPHFPH